MILILYSSIGRRLIKMCLFKKIETLCVSKKKLYKYLLATEIILALWKTKATFCEELAHCDFCDQFNVSGTKYQLNVITSFIHERKRKTHQLVKTLHFQIVMIRPKYSSRSKRCKYDILKYLFHFIKFDFK